MNASRLLVWLSMLAGMSLLAEKPVIVAQATGALSGHGRRDTIEIVMVSGEEYVDTEVWCNMSYGGTPKYRGRFVVRVHLSGSRPVETDLGPLIGVGRSTLEFNGRGWPLVLRDLNHDGRLEFTLGQYATCSGSEYTVLGVDPSGKVSALSKAIYSGGHTNSTDGFHPTKHGFRFTTPYDNRSGSYSCTEFVWRAKQKIFVEGTTLPEPCTEDLHGDGSGTE